MTTPTATANDAARERLRATVRATLAAVQDGTADPSDAEQAIMTTAQQWATEGHTVNAAPTAPCPGSGTTVSRWYAPNGWGETGAEVDPTPDPGPYTEGERVTCRHCSADVPVTPVAATQRETGRQYVARLAQH